MRNPIYSLWLIHRMVVLVYVSSIISSYTCCSSIITKSVLFQKCSGLNGREYNTLLINWSYSDADFYSKLGRTFYKFKLSEMREIMLRANRNIRNSQSDAKKLFGVSGGLNYMMIRRVELLVIERYQYLAVLDLQKC